jgi:hypothetical protein
MAVTSPSDVLELRARFEGRRLTSASAYSDSREGIIMFSQARLSGGVPSILGDGTRWS